MKYPSVFFIFFLILLCSRKGHLCGLYHIILSVSFITKEAAVFAVYKVNWGCIVNTVFLPLRKLTVMFVPFTRNCCFVLSFSDLCGFQ